MPPSERDVEIARSLFGSKGDITAYIVRLGISVENTTKSEIDKMCKGRPRRRIGGGIRCRISAACRAILRKIGRGRPAPSPPE